MSLLEDFYKATAKMQGGRATPLSGANKSLQIPGPSRTSPQGYDDEAGTYSSKSKQSGEPNVPGALPALAADTGQITSPYPGDYSSQAPQAIQSMGFPTRSPLDSTMQYVNAANSAGSLVGLGIKGAQEFGASSPELNALGSGLSDVNTAAGYAGTAYNLATGNYTGAAKSLVQPALAYGTQYAAGVGTQAGITAAAQGTGLTAAEYAALGSGTSIAGGTVPVATGAGAVLSGIGSAVSIAMPYYALAKLGGTLGSAFFDNNPQYAQGPDIMAGRNPAAHLAYSLREPLAVEEYYTNLIPDDSSWKGPAKQAIQYSNPLEVGSWISGNAPEKLAGTIDPIGGMAGALAESAGAPEAVQWALDPVGSAMRSSCVLFSFLYPDDRKKRLTALLFCGRFATRSTLIGYYSVSRILVWLMKKSPKFLSFIKTYLVGTLYHYMRYRLGKEKGVRKWQTLLMWTFWAICNLYYLLRLPRYYPPGYEECVRSAESRTPHMEVQHG